MLRSDGRTTRLTATGDIFGGPARLVHINYIANGVAGEIVVRDGGPAGDILVSVATPADESMNSVNLPVPIRFREKPHATLTNVVSATFVFV